MSSRFRGLLSEFIEPTLNQSEANEALKIAKQYHKELKQQWEIFKQGKQVTMIKNHTL